MHEDSPAPFIVFRTPRSRSSYDRALELVGEVHGIVGAATTRFYLRDRLDRAATGLVFELGRLAATTQKWKIYRRAQEHAADVATVLDILVHQKAAPLGDLEKARALVRDLRAELDPLSRG
jgi:hypothetical protein